MKKSILSVLLLFSLLVPSFSVYGEQPETTPETAGNTTETTAATPTLLSETAILMDAASGEIVYEKKANQKMYPASITKLMTILLALENCELTEKITFSHDAVYSIEPGSAHIAIQEGEILTMEQALRAIILRSANEVSNAVAEHIDGSIEAFAKHMTDRAKELGCKNTNFVNANGLHNETHITTAYDMALIAQELLTHEEYRSMMSETYYEIPPTNQQEEMRYLHGQHQMLNSNSLYFYEYAIGGKTGFTDEALNTLVTYAKKGDMELIAVVMKSYGAEHYTDTAALFDYGFSNFETVKIFSSADYIKTIRVTETYNEKSIFLEEITATTDSDLYFPLPVGTKVSDLQIHINCPESAEAPVKKGQTIGTISVSLKDETIKTVDLKAQKTVDIMTEEEHEAADKAALIAFMKKIGIGIGVVLLAFCILLCITRTIGYLRYRKRRRRRRQKRRYRR